MLSIIYIFVMISKCVQHFCTVQVQFFQLVLVLHRLYNSQSCFCCDLTIRQIQFLLSLAKYLLTGEGKR